MNVFLAGAIIALLAWSAVGLAVYLGRRRDRKIRADRERLEGELRTFLGLDREGRRRS